MSLFPLAVPHFLICCKSFFIRGRESPSVYLSPGRLINSARYRQIYAHTCIYIYLAISFTENVVVLGFKQARRRTRYRFVRGCPVAEDNTAPAPRCASLSYNSIKRLFAFAVFFPFFSFFTFFVKGASRSRRGQRFDRPLFPPGYYFRFDCLYAVFTLSQCKHFLLSGFFLG